MSFWRRKKMTEDSVNEMMQRNQCSAMLLGEITGRLSALSSKADGTAALLLGNLQGTIIEQATKPDATLSYTLLSQDIKNLLEFVVSRINSIYYETK